MFSVMLITATLLSQKINSITDSLTARYETLVTTRQDTLVTAKQDTLVTAGPDTLVTTRQD
ncbi:MAG: hypothetical protein GX158_06835, partial [Bacteroidales bacterium]|nr:hypothetical protein [Bacteroidales bacterium]